MAIYTDSDRKVNKNYVPPASLKKGDLTKVHIDDDFEVDYSAKHGAYRVTIFDDCHFWDEFWFSAYENKEIKMLIGKWFSALEDSGVNPWANKECIAIAGRHGYTEKEYKNYLRTIS